MIGDNVRPLTFGLVHVVLGCVAFGFITNFKQALALRILEGLVNGNVATVRTMVSEVVIEKRLVILETD